MAKPIPYDPTSPDEGEDEGRDMRKIVLYDDEALKLMQGWTGGQSDPLYAISSTGGWNYAWVFSDAISNIDRDLSRVKKLGRNKFQLGQGTFSKTEIDELRYIRDALQMTLDDPESVMVEEGRGGHVADRPDLSAAIASWNNGDAYRDGSLRLLVDKGLVEHQVRPGRRGWVPTPAGVRAGLRTDHLNETREVSGRHVADFNTLDDLIDHEITQNGASHIDRSNIRGPRIFYPTGDGYEVSSVWQKGGYWHAQAPSARGLTKHLSRGAQPIGGARTRLARDYEAVDNHDRHIAGPFKSYSDARQAAGTAGVVKFVPSRGKAGRATEAQATRRKPSVRLTPAEQFFYDHAGFSYPTGANAKQQEAAHVQLAKSLARAEAEAEKRGWTVEWEHDQDADTSWMDPEQIDDYESGRTEILSAILRDENGEVLGSLGGVALTVRRSQRDSYGRVVEAELAQEALASTPRASKAREMRSAHTPTPVRRR